MVGWIPIRKNSHYPENNGEAILMIFWARFERQNSGLSFKVVICFSWRRYGDSSFDSHVFHVWLRNNLQHFSFYADLPGKTWGNPRGSTQRGFESLSPRWRGHWRGNQQHHSARKLYSRFVPHSVVVYIACSRWWYETKTCSWYSCLPR